LHLMATALQVCRQRVMLSHESCPSTPEQHLYVRLQDIGAAGIIMAEILLN
jgi:hypothetical protein